MKHSDPETVADTPMLIRQTFLALGLLSGILHAKAANAQTSPNPPPSQPSSTAPLINPLIGPSFPCPQPEDPLAQLVCSTPALALLDMQFVQSYEALYQQVGITGDPTVREEDIQFDLAVRTKCGIATSQASNPSPTPPPAAPPGSDQCVIPAYKQQIALWKGMLQGPAAEEASRPIQDQVALQSRLQALGFIPPQAQIDGVFGIGTRAAIIKWQTSIGRQPTGLLGNTDAQALLSSSPSTSQPTASSAQQVSSSPMTPSNGGMSVEQAWQPLIPYAACMSKNGFLLQTFVQEGVLPTDPIASAAINQCKSSNPQGNTSSPVASNQPPASDASNQPTGVAADASNVPLQTAPPASNGQNNQPQATPSADGLTFSNPDGIAYAKLNETTWTEKSTPNPLTDKVDVTAVSQQDNGSGVTTQITGSCKYNTVSFEALVVDSSGNSTVNVPSENNDGQLISGQLRINADAMSNAVFNIGNYSNQFDIVDLSEDLHQMDKDQQALISLGMTPQEPANSVWRILIQFDTDHGSVLIKIPVYDPAIEDVMRSCFK